MGFRQHFSGNLISDAFLHFLPPQRGVAVDLGLYKENASLQTLCHAVLCYVQDMDFGPHFV